MSTLQDVHSAWASFQMNLNLYRSHSELKIDNHAKTTPVVLLSGFLGAGKSHLLAQLLQNNCGLRVKALVNDIGSLSFDPTFIASESDQEIVLVNGCGCCDQTSDLAESLEYLARNENCDLIVLEGSGASDPWSLSHIVEASPFVHLNRIVSVIDERDIQTTLEMQDDARCRELQRRESAHCIVISHCDQLSERECNELIALLALELPGRTITTSSLTSPAWRVLLPASPIGARPLPALPESLHEDLHVVTVRQEKSISRHAFMSALQRSRPGLVRAKGLLNIDGDAFQVQVTRSTVMIDPHHGKFDIGSITLISNQPKDCLLLTSLIN